MRCTRPTAWRIVPTSSTGSRKTTCCATVSVSPAASWPKCRRQTWMEGSFMKAAIDLAAVLPVLLTRTAPISTRLSTFLACSSPSLYEAKITAFSGRTEERSCTRRVSLVERWTSSRTSTPASDDASGCGGEHMTSCRGLSGNGKGEGPKRVVAGKQIRSSASRRLHIASRADRMRECSSGSMLKMSSLPRFRGSRRSNCSATLIRIT
mmetsp:Transcript_1052/g.3197  ORF Transcript_1052/g.3197 Transcript_1052/m.3197 type:complete len:208 (+) Transcript_1052:919-1542(+)